MLGLEVFVFCLLFGALTHSQQTECVSECRDTETFFDVSVPTNATIKISCFLSLALFHKVLCVFFLQRRMTVPQMYTSPQTRLRPSPCRSHPQDPWWRASRFFFFPQFTKHSTKQCCVISSKRSPPSQFCSVCYMLLDVGLHQAVCAAFRRCGIQRCCADQLEHRWTALLPRAEGVQSHRIQDRFH